MNIRLVELGKRTGGEAMALINILKILNFDNLTDAQKAELKRRLQAHQQELNSALTAVNRGLKTLAAKKKSKTSAKRKTPKR
jgi:hypothetical protein